MVLTAGAAGASPAYSYHPTHQTSSTCASGNIASGSYSTLTVTGNCTIPDGATVNISRNLVVARGATLNAMTASTVQIKGNVLVSPKATLSLGCSFELTQSPFPGAPPFCPVGVSNDQVNGSVIATNPHTVKVNGVTIHGNFASVGGGTAVTGPTSSSCERAPSPLNFPIKDNTIDGNVMITGWQGCWLGYIRNVTGGSVAILANHTADADSTEIVTNTISGSLLCAGNKPAPQIGDSGGASNLVSGRNTGQCVGV